jgi:peptidoglycan/xylan/chitin deacetylase (PgdA/CDA1 family)
MVKNTIVKYFEKFENQPRRYQDAIVTLYHAVGSIPSEYCVSYSVIFEQIDYLFANEADYVLATELASNLVRLRTNQKICITFDDGNISSYNATLKILEMGAKCTHFIVPYRMTRGDTDTMSWEQVLDLDSHGVEIGSRSLSHPHLTKLSRDDLKMELESSKQILEDKLGKPVTSFAYPYGEYDNRTREVVREAGYLCAFTTRHLYTPENTDIYSIPRFEPLDSARQMIDLYDGRALYYYRLLRLYLGCRETLTRRNRASRTESLQ